MRKPESQDIPEWERSRESLWAGLSSMASICPRWCPEAILPVPSFSLGCLRFSLSSRQDKGACPVLWAPPLGFRKGVGPTSHCLYSSLRTTHLYGVGPVTGWRWPGSVILSYLALEIKLTRRSLRYTVRIYMPKIRSTPFFSTYSSLSVFCRYKVDQRCWVLYKLYLPKVIGRKIEVQISTWNFCFCFQKTFKNIYRAGIVPTDVLLKS